MRVAYIGILLSLFIAVAVATENREALNDENTEGLSWKGEAHHFLRHGKEEEKVNSSRLLTWWRPKNTRSCSGGRSSSSNCDGTARANTKSIKKTKEEQEVDSYDWIRKYRKWARKWQKKQQKKREKKGKKQIDEYYESDTGVFPVKIPLFSSTTVRGYNLKTQKRLRRELTEAVKFKVNRVVDQSNKLIYNREEDVGFLPPQFAMPEGSSPQAGEVDDFGTNTVEEDIDEGDLLKVSDDGRYAFTVYGGNILVWNVAEGNRSVTTEALPVIEATTKEVLPPWIQPGPLPPVLLEQQPEAEVAETEQVDQEDQEEDGDENRRYLQLIAPDIFYPCWDPVPVPTIHSLMTYKDRLVVIASGYGPSIREKLDYKPALYEAYSTKILLYDISTLDTTGKLTLVKDTDVHGRFDSIRALDNRAHLVTFSGVDTYTFIDEPLNRYSHFSDLNDEDYSEAARELAEDKLIPGLVDRLVSDLFANGVPTDIARVNMLQQTASTDGKLEEELFSQGILNHFAQVTSFDMLEPTDESNELTVTKTGAFMSSSWGHTYANEEMLLIATQSWDFIPRVGAGRQTTYFYGFALLGNGQATPAAVGSLEGTLLNEFSVDIVDGYMRVAITIRRNMWRRSIEDTEEIDLPPTENFVKVLKIPDLDDTDDLRGPGPYLKEVGSTKSLGKENETFFGVRFSNKFAYLVTFFQTDPLYAVSFEDPTSPEVLDALEITGFSRYLHFIFDEKMLIGVGQEADESGRAIGLQVSLYNITDPGKPGIIARYPFELEKYVQSSSSAEFDYKALRFVDLKREEGEAGILIIPFRVDAYYPREVDDEKEDLNYNGFILFDVSPKGISERFRIPHGHPIYYRLGCYQSTNLPQRSFVVKGDVTTLKGHEINKYNLDTEELLDSINLDRFE